MSSQTRILGPTEALETPQILEAAHVLT